MYCMSVVYNAHKLGPLLQTDFVCEYKNVSIGICMYAWMGNYHYVRKLILSVFNDIKTEQ